MFWEPPVGPSAAGNAALGQPCLFLQLDKRLAGCLRQLHVCLCGRERVLAVCPASAWGVPACRSLQLHVPLTKQA